MGAIVTGGASGIGAACVARLREAGAHVASLDLTHTADADLAISADVASEQQVVDGVARAVAELGRLDVAVLSAGVGGGVPLLELTTDEWDRVVNVNLRGAFVCLRECARAMASSRGGAIVAVTSVSGFLADRTLAHYAASKAGLAQLVRSAARELGTHGIRVNAVAPGTTDTPMFAAHRSSARLSRAGEPPLPTRARRHRRRGRAGRSRAAHTRLGDGPDPRCRRWCVVAQPHRSTGSARAVSARVGTTVRSSCATSMRRCARRDGIGFEVMMDMPFVGDWVTLFDAPSNRLRSGVDPAGVLVELIGIPAS